MRRWGRFGEIAEADSEESSDPESEKGVRIQLKKLDTEKVEEGKSMGVKADNSKIEAPKGESGIRSDAAESTPTTGKDETGHFESPQAKRAVVHNRPAAAATAKTTTNISKTCNK